MNLKKVFKALFAFLFLLILSQTTFSQTNLSQQRVDDLTDTQIRQIMQRAEAIGYTESSQIAQMAVAQGMSEAESQKLVLRIDKIRKEGDNKLNVNGGQNNGGLYNNGFQNNNFSRRTYNNYADSTDTARIRRNNLNNPNLRAERDVFGNLIPKIFGEDLFKSNNRLTFEPNLRMATPKSYVVGPDDELLVDITGDNEANYQLKVNPEGTIRIQYVGIIAVGGLTIEQASAKIKNMMSRTYPGLRTGRTNVAINLGNIRSIKVSIIGEAVKPGSYTLSSLSTVFNALYASGGPNKNGSFRTIQLIRNNRVVSTVDVYDFLLKGMQQNLRLQDQDVINVPVYKTRVEMSGEVKRPALYEVLNTESLQDVISFAGGFTGQAYTANIKVLKNTNKERKIADVNADDFKSYKPSNGDKYIIEAILDRFENRVEIEGAVFRPGKYELEKGLTLKSLIRKADGLKEDAFLNRGYIQRLNIDNSLSLVSFDVQKVLNGSNPDIPLQREDKITVSSIFDLRDEYKLEIQGEVRRPGIFKYAENTNLESLIQMAGGFKEGATPNRVEISRRVKSSDASSKSSSTAQIFTVDIDKNLKLSGAPFVLQPFDIVFVRSTEGYQVQKNVTVQGEVLYPGTYTIERKDERISDIIKRAGGLTALAFPEGGSLKRPGPPKMKTQKTFADSIRQEDEKVRLLNLRRLQRQAGVIDTTSIRQDSVSLRSDFVGIDLSKILKDANSKIDLILQDGDIINIPIELQTVRVSGEVLKPTNIVYKKGKSMRQYINESGGFTYNAHKKRAYIEYANGSIKAAKNFLFFRSYPSVKPGAEIFVPKHPPRDKIGIAGIAGIASALSSVAVILITLLK
jgi:protein involved in polysaccharide export with SLBB domain